MVDCCGAQTATIIYLRTVCLRINLRLNNIFCCLSNFAFLNTLIIKSSNHKSVSSYIAPLSTHVACPVSSSSFVYIHCIWVSSWIYLSFSSIEHISSSVLSSCSLYYLPPFSPIQSFSSRLYISPWTHHIPLQYPFFHSALLLISIQPYCSLLPLSNSGRQFFCFC